MTDSEQNAAQPHGRYRVGRKSLCFVLIVVFAGAALLLLFFGGLHRRNGMDITVMFSNVNGLREGAPVRVSGFDVGTVKSIRLKPEIKDHPVEVRLQLRPPDQLKIPRDATVGLETAGILGETFVDVGIQRASGPALRGGEVLVSDFSPSDTLTRLRQFFGAVQKTMEAAKSASCPQPEKAAAVPGPVHKEASKAPTSR